MDEKNSASVRSEENRATQNIAGATEKENYPPVANTRPERFDPAMLDNGTEINQNLNSGVAKNHNYGEKIAEVNSQKSEPISKGSKKDSFQNALRNNSNNINMGGKADGGHNLSRSNTHNSFYSNASVRSKNSRGSRNSALGNKFPSINKPASMEQNLYNPQINTNAMVRRQGSGSKTDSVKNFADIQTGGFN